MAPIAAALPEIAAAVGEVGAAAGAAEGASAAAAGASEGAGGLNLTGAAKNISGGQFSGGNPLQTAGDMANYAMSSAMKNQQQTANRTLSGLNRPPNQPGSFDSATDIF